MPHYHHTPDNKQKLGPFSPAQLAELAASGNLQSSDKTPPADQATPAPTSPTSPPQVTPSISPAAKVSEEPVRKGGRPGWVAGVVMVLFIAGLAALVVFLAGLAALVVFLLKGQPTKPVAVYNLQAPHDTKPAAVPDQQPLERQPPVRQESNKTAALEARLTESEQRLLEALQTTADLRNRLADAEQKLREPTPTPAPVNKRLRLLAPANTTAFALDQYALQTPKDAEESVESLSRYLTEPADNDREKVRIIFRWIADRIAYDRDSYFRSGSSVIGAAAVLKQRRGDSEGFARLFEALCGEAGINVAVIPGSLRVTGPASREKFIKTPHVWNAVKLDGHWRLLDVTLASGSLQDEKFVKRFNDLYFLTPPDRFIFSHLPTEQRWQLLERPLSAKEFEGAVEEKYPGSAKEFEGAVEEKYPGGKIKRNYVVDEEGRKHGLYREYHENGQPKVTANVKAGEWDGPYISYHPNGLPHVIAAYKNGKRTGDYTERTESGQLRLAAAYHDGRLQGHINLYSNNQLTCIHECQEGDPPLTRTPADIQAILATIELAPQLAEKADPLTAERQAALRRLMAYRYLVGVPYANLELDEQMNTYCQAGAKLCEKIGELNHTPENPGWPKEEYDIAYKGTSSSNLHCGMPSIAKTVDDYMFDSHPSNIDRLGHRRWCINPSLQKTGFGKSGQFSAMYSFDKSQQDIPDYDYISYPAAGFMPIQYFGLNHAWSVSLNPKKYRQPTNKVTVKIMHQPDAVAEEKLPIKLETLPLNYKNVDHGRFGIPNCIIFRPEGFTLADGKGYWVEIDGLERIDGTPAKVRFVVLFVNLQP